MSDIQKDILEKMQEGGKEAGERAKLAPEKKAAIRAHLARFIDAGEAVRVRESGRHILKSNNLFLSFKKSMSVLLTMAIVAALGGGTSYAAESSLPGDVLYPVKLLVNEPVSASLALSAEAMAEWKTRVVERRLEEASELAAEGRFEGETKTRVSDRFEKQSGEAREAILKVEASGNVRGAASVASRLEAALGAHEAVLGRLSATATVELSPIDKKILKELKGAKGLRIRLESDDEGDKNAPEVKVAAEARVSAVEKILSEAQRQFANKKDAMSVEAAAEIEAELKEAGLIVVEARAKIAEEHYGEAFRLANAAMRKIQGARVFINARVLLERDAHDDDVDDGIEATSSVSGTSDGSKESDDHGRNGKADNADADVNDDNGEDSDGELKVEAGADVHSSAGGGGVGVGADADAKGEVRLGL